MALHLKHHLKRPPPYLPHHSSLLLRHSSSLPPPPPPEDSTPPESPNPSSSSSSSLFSFITDIKGSLKSSPPIPPRRTAPPPQPRQQYPPSSPPSAFYEIGKHLASFRNRSENQAKPHNPTTASSSPTPISFHDLLKQNQNVTGRSDGPSFDSIRQSLRQFSRPGATQPGSVRRNAPFSLKDLELTGKGSRNTMQQSSLPVSIFGKEVSEKRGERIEEEEEGKAKSNEFVKLYSYEELGERLRSLRAEGDRKGGQKEGFSLSELNERLVKLREHEEKKITGSGLNFGELRHSLHKLQQGDEVKKTNRRSSLLFSLFHHFLILFCLQTGCICFVYYAGIELE